MCGIEKWRLEVRTWFLDEMLLLLNEDYECVLTLDFDDVRFTDLDIFCYCIEKLKIKYFLKHCCCDYSMKKASK